ncbi:hypothetical protein INR49_025087 [Caranx melampygus]|nr:hypothetical protein INR49_025087 [Caranx melampygus]
MPCAPFSNWCYITAVTSKEARCLRHPAAGTLKLSQDPLHPAQPTASPPGRPRLTNRAVDAVEQLRVESREKRGRGPRGFRHRALRTTENKR